jgi:AcrR family transcriptional regulator
MPPSAGLPSGGPARRTDWTESRQRILGAARDLFAERGYRGATTRGLADHAGVSLMTLHRHFPTKAELFEAAVLTPLGEFVESYLRSRAERGRSATRDSGHEMEVFYDGLMEALLGEDRLLLAAALSFTDDEALASEQMRRYVDAFFAQLETLVAEKVEEYDLAIDPRLAPRVMVGAALGVVVYRGWLFPAGPKPSRSELVAELSKITIWGVAGKPGGARLGLPPES